MARFGNRNCRLPEYYCCGLAVLLMLLLYVKSSNANKTVVEFNRKSTGVAFSVYAHSNVTSQENWSTYTLEDVTTMMRVISTRFSKVSTFGVGANNVPYVKNATYNQSNSQVYSAEAAAIVNKELKVAGSPRPPIEMHIGLWAHAIPQQLDTEISLAEESIERANAIFPGTVKGVVFSQDNIHSDVNVAKAVLDNLKRLNETIRRTFGVRLGSRQSCDGIGSGEVSELAEFRNGIVTASDFIICDIGTDIDLTASAPRLFQINASLERLKPGIEIMVQAGKSARRDNETEVTALREYWQTADKLVGQFGGTMWILEALDNPWKRWNTRVAHLGWWTLTDDARTNASDAYVEKVTGQKANTTIVPTIRPTNKPTHDNKRKRGKNGAMGKYSIDITVFLIIIISIGIVA